ncbi:hypothetical protein F5878DRAFT_529792 [Lentinula raphanica]|uniref:Uncharacterized protein n=1 Tax=Lentinula raphanica TaxID=153919 RepID=A0AA38PGY4_9AGAR|nr:hypothetical protein F5878DRAFT_529792 [Lentinula raphanica]
MYSKAPATDNLPNALLLVYSDNGNVILEAEFNSEVTAFSVTSLLHKLTDRLRTGWYDEEHVPQRVKFPGCTHATRYQAIDSKHPPWVALYHLDDPGIAESKEWYQLREVASENERVILETVPIMTRSIYAVFSRHAKDTDQSSSGNRSPGKVVCIVHIQIERRESEDSTSSSSNSVKQQAEPELEAEFRLWHRDLITKAVSTMPGWVRSTMYTRYSGSDMKTTPELKAAMDSGLLVIHEWDEGGDALEVMKMEANVAAQVGIWENENRCKVRREVRIVSLHRAW